MPICGDQDGSESPLVLNCPNFVPLTDVQTFQVLGLASPVELRFDFVFREALFNNELGFFTVDDATGSIGELKPGDPGYLAAALDRATIIFPSGSTAFTPDVTLPFNGGDILVFFIVQDGTLANLLANNPNNELGRHPLAFFSLDRLNPDGVDHFVGFENTSDGYTQFGFEDLTGGGDLDYDDVVYNVIPRLVPLTGLLTLPFSVGETWYVCQGYNGPVSHRRVAALDLSIDPESFAGRRGCSPDTSDASTGKAVQAPAAGTVKAHIENEGEKDMLCLELKGIAIMKIGHLTDMLPVGTKFQRDDVLGKVAAPSRGNGDYAHIHVQLQDLSTGCEKAKKTIPFSGKHRFEDAPDMPYDDNGTPDKPGDDPENQWRGTVLTRAR